MNVKKDCNKGKPGECSASRNLIFPSLLSALALGLTIFAVPALAQERGVSSGKMSVEFLFSIEYTSGRSQKLLEPEDIFFDRKTKELYVVDAGQRKIIIYDNNGMYVQEIKLKETKSAALMVTVDGSGDFYVGYSSNPKISRLDYRGNFIEDIYLPGTINLPGNNILPARLESGPDGRVYVLKSTGGIVKIDPEGENHEDINISGEGHPNTIIGMGIDSAGRFLFSDLRPYSIVIFDPVKKTFQRFGSAGVLYGQIARPSGVTADEAGHIFVLSLTLSKVSCYDRDGNFIEEFGGLGDNYGQFYMPIKIASDGQDRLYVLENTMKRIQVFKIRFLQEKEKSALGGPASGTGDGKPAQKEGGDGGPGTTGR